jgi:hypothetical protein
MARIPDEENSPAVCRVTAGAAGRSDGERPLRPLTRRMIAQGTSRDRLSPLSRPKIAGDSLRGISRVNGSGHLDMAGGHLTF